MMESKVFADNFSRSFSESGDFFQFLSARQARSKWMTAPSKELRFEPVERGSTLGNLYMQIYPSFQRRETGMILGSSRFFSRGGGGQTRPHFYIHYEE